LTENLLNLAGEIALRYFQRHRGAPNLPRRRLAEAFLVPSIQSAAPEWLSGEGPWRTTPRDPTLLAPPKGLSYVGVSDAGPSSDAFSVVEVRGGDRAAYRGKVARVFQKMVDASVHFVYKGAPADARMVGTIPMGLISTGPVRADGLPDTQGLCPVVAMILALRSDGGRLWEHVAFGDAVLTVPSAVGSSIVGYYRPPDQCRSPEEAALLVSRMFSP
jgi:hypothetical protein